MMFLHQWNTSNGGSSRTASLLLFLLIFSLINGGSTLGQSGSAGSTAVLSDVSSGEEVFSSKEAADSTTMTSYDHSNSSPSPPVFTRDEDFTTYAPTTVPALTSSDISSSVDNITSASSRSDHLGGVSSIDSGSSSSRSTRSSAHISGSPSTYIDASTSSLATPTPPLILGEGTQCVERYLEPHSMTAETYNAPVFRSTSSQCQAVALCQRTFCTCLGGVTSNAGTCNGLPSTADYPSEGNAMLSGAQCSTNARCFSSFMSCLNLNARQYSTAGRTMNIVGGKSGCQIWADSLHSAISGIDAGISYNTTSLAPSCRYLACTWLAVGAGLGRCGSSSSDVSGTSTIPTTSNNPVDLCRAPLQGSPFYGRFRFSGSNWGSVLADRVKVQQVSAAIRAMLEEFTDYAVSITSLKIGSLIADITIDAPPESSTLIQLLEGFKRLSKASTTERSSDTAVNPLQPLQALYDSYSSSAVTNGFNRIDDRVEVESIIRLSSSGGEPWTEASGVGGANSNPTTEFALGTSVCNGVCIALCAIAAVCLIILVVLCIRQQLCTDSRSAGKRKSRREFDYYDEDQVSSTKGQDDVEMNDQEGAADGISGLPRRYPQQENQTPSKFLSGAPRRYHSKPDPTIDFAFTPREGDEVI